SSGKKLIELVESTHSIASRKTQAQGYGGTGRNAELVMNSSLSTRSLRVDCTCCTMHNSIVDTIFDEGGRIGEVKETLDIRLIVGEEHSRDIFSILICTLPCQSIASDAGVL